MRSNALWLLLCVAACGDGGAPAAREWAGAIDTVGGVVRVTNPGQGAWREGDAWRLEPEQRIGGAEDAGPYTFGSISAIEAGPDGRVYVLDRQANELRIFDADGTHIRSIGRTGSGPAEFTRANGLLWFGDTLVVVDGSGARYSLLDADGALLRTAVRPISSYGWTFQGGSDNGLLYESGLVRGEDGFRSAILGVRLEATPVIVDTVEFPRSRAPRMQPFEVTTPTGSSSMSVPFWPGPVWHMNGDGTLWYGHGSEHRLLRLTLDGDTLRQIDTALQPLPVTDADRNAWRQLGHVQQFETMGGQVDMSRIPREKPFFRELIVDDSDHVWIEPHMESDTASFDIFDAEGRYLGRVATGVRRDAAVKPIARRGKLHLVALNDGDVPYVQVMRVIR